MRFSRLPIEGLRSEMARGRPQRRYTQQKTALVAASPCRSFRPTGDDEFARHLVAVAVAPCFNRAEIFRVGLIARRGVEARVRQSHRSTREGSPARFFVRHVLQSRREPIHDDRRETGSLHRVTEHVACSQLKKEWTYVRRDPAIDDWKNLGPSALISRAPHGDDGSTARFEHAHHFAEGDSWPGQSSSRNSFSSVVAILHPGSAPLTGAKTVEHHDEDHFRSCVGRASVRY